MVQISVPSEDININLINVGCIRNNKVKTSTINILVRTKEVFQLA